MGVLRGQVPSARLSGPLFSPHGIEQTPAVLQIAIRDLRAVPATDPTTLMWSEAYEWDDYSGICLASDEVRLVQVPGAVSTLLGQFNTNELSAMASGVLLGRPVALLLDANGGFSLHFVGADDQVEVHRVAAPVAVPLAGPRIFGSRLSGLHLATASLGDGLVALGLTLQPSEIDTDMPAPSSPTRIAFFTAGCGVEVPR